MFPYCEAASDNGRPPILFLHGFLMSRAIWADTLPGVTAFARPVIMELMGHGRSPAPEEPTAYSISHHIDCMETIRTELGIEKWMVCGHSLGACVALHYAFAKPDAVSAVVFTNSISALGNLTQGASAEQIAKTARHIETAGHSALKAIDAHPSNMRNLSPLVQSSLVADCEAIDPVGIARCITHMVPSASASEILPKIKAPMLIVNGVLETRFQPLRDWAEREHPAIGIFDTKTGHSPNAEAPEEFNRALRDFVERHAV